MFGQRHLNFSEFLDQRAEQITKFRDILKLQTKKKGHQALPKCIRRRAMSHNRYRIPSKMRKLYQQQLIKSQNMQRVPKCRKHIRKKSRLISSYKDRHCKVKWLSTHLWTARRMRMINYYGYKAGQTPNQKCFRSSYRHFRHNSCMIDLSYYQCLTIKLGQSSDRIPRNITINASSSQNRTDNPQKLNSIVSLDKLNTARSYEGYLYDQSDRLVCPFIAFNSGLQNDQTKKHLLRCFFHPSASEDVSKLMSQNLFQAELGKCKSQLYCLIGPQWNNKLHKALKIYGIDSSPESINNLKFKQSPTEFFVSQTQKKQEKVPYISNPSPDLIKQKYNYNLVAEDIRTQTIKILQLLKSQNNKDNHNNFAQQKRQQFWKFYKEIIPYSQKIQFKITTRSKYTHKRKHKLSKQNKKKVIALQTKKRQLITSKNAISQEQGDQCSHQMVGESLQNIKKQIKQFFVEDRQSRGQQMQQQNSTKNRLFKVNPVLVTSFKRQQFYEGCYILCSDQDSCRLWRILSKLNIKVIGLQQLKHIRLQSQHLSFPQNYIQTSSFQRYALEERDKAFRRIQRRPPQKRINFLKINSPNPVSLIQKSLVQNCLKVFIQMVNRGSCFSHSYIYELNTDDIIQIDQQLSLKGTVGIVQSETNKSQFTAGSKRKENTFFNYSKQSVLSLLDQLEKTQAKRKLIGRVTTGGYLYSKSKEGGIGYIHKQVGTSIQHLKDDGYVLIRKVSSPHYYLGQITKMYPDLNKE